MADYSLDALRYFTVVARCGSFSVASGLLYVSQPAISQCIRRLEETLCCPLFVRNKKRLALTPSGLLLFNAVSSGLQEIEAGVLAVIRRQNIETGEIKIAATDTLCKYHLLPLIKTMQQKYPGIHFGITNGTSPRCKQLLVQGAVDIAVANIEEGDEERFALRKQHFFSDVFVANKNFSKLKNKQVALKTLAQYPLVVLDGETVTRSFFNSLFRQSGLKARPSVELQSVELLIEMAKTGLGVAFVPSMCLKPEDELFVVDIKEKPKQRSFAALTLKNAVQSPLATAFIAAF